MQLLLLILVLYSYSKLSDFCNAHIMQLVNNGVYFCVSLHVLVTVCKRCDAFCGQSVIVYILSLSSSLSMLIDPFVSLSVSLSLSLSVSVCVYGWLVGVV